MVGNTKIQFPSCLLAGIELVLAPFVFVPSDGVCGRFDLAALRGCHTLCVCLFIECVVVVLLLDMGAVHVLVYV
jgi:hypothetical protein